MKRLLFVLALLQCTSTNQLTSLEIEKATYQKTSESNGDKSISFELYWKGFSEGVEVTSFSVNGQELSYEIHTQDLKQILSATKNYPSPPGGRGIDPLPPGEPGQPLYFQQDFKARLIFKTNGKYDTLRIASFNPISN